jgi:hypothetical protein
MDEATKKKQISNSRYGQTIVNSVRSKEDLIAMELILLDSEINIIKQRITVMKEFLSGLTQSDPYYGMVLIEIDMDVINKDELENRKLALLKVKDQ